MMASKAMNSKAMKSIEWLDWPASDRIRACYTLRTGGYSQAPYDSFNMGVCILAIVSVSVRKNRQHLQALINSPVDIDAICWLRQVHSTRVVEASDSCSQH